jgi:hypothetical protein
MQTEAIFENIASRIHLELVKASESILVAVAWLTNTELFLTLCEKAKSGVKVELMLMNDEINNSSLIDYNRLSLVGGKLWKIGNKKGPNRLMHNKFCIIDNSTVINGSYNWTNKANSNYESITIISENIELAERFIEEFQSIKKSHFAAEDKNILIDLSIIRSRLTTLKEAIRINDTEDIKYNLQKLKKCLPPLKDSNLSIVYEIVTSVENKIFSEAINSIDSFISKYVSLNLYIDTEIAALALEMKSLELQVSSLEDEKVELEKLLHDFEIRHNRELGDLLLKILKLRKEKYQNEAKKDPKIESEFQEAEKDYNEYQKSYDVLKQEDIKEISEDQRKELKKLYRNASKLCHPDAVAEKYKKDAEFIFKELNNAYSANDINKVKLLLKDLENGLFRSGSEIVSEKVELLQKVNYLRLLRDELEGKVLSIKKSDPYQIISSIKNWDTYFSELKNQLSLELQSIENEISNG